jgi:hypothetical protein
MSNDLYAVEWYVLSAFVGILIYVMPWIIGICRNVQRSWLLLLVTILVGWTVIGWVACIVWAWYARTVVDQAYLRYDTGWQSNEPQSLFRPDPSKPDRKRLNGSG